MNHDTPAREIRQRALDLNVEAFRTLLAFLPKAWRTRTAFALDIRYGLGGWARALREAFPETEVTGYEQDPATAQRAWRDAGVSLRVERFRPEDRPGRFDLLCADFNTLTALKRDLLEEALAEVAPDYVVFTDVSCSKLHLNYRSYGLTEPNLDAYWRAFPVPGYELVAWEKKHHAASTALFRRADAVRA
jgi:hypothetical protein